jgi:16S rRNA processing protein RimM|tara:strand:+ start:73 stop:570 length:498 start_codon:yes stop_codon:yes gene_type:complete
MKKPDLQYLGEFIKLFSFKGEIILYSDNTISLIENLDTIFIDIDGAFVPFQIKKSKSHKKNIFRVLLEGISSESEAKDLLKKSVYINKLENQDNINNIVDNFNVYNNNEYLGIVISTINKTGQTIIEVKMKEKIVLIPFVDEFIVEINYDLNKIDMILPDGLLDI